MNPAKIVWIAAAILLGGVALVLLFRPAAAGVTDVDAAAVERLVGQSGVVILDVRTPGEFEMGRIEGAINVPVNELAGSAEAWDRDAIYVVYCATGQRSIPAVQTLSELGFVDVRHFAAGIQAWNQPLAKGADTPSGRVETAGLPVLIEFYTDA